MDLKIGDEHYMEGRKYIVTDIKDDGNYVFETPWEIARRMKPPRVGDEVVVENLPYYITKIIGNEVQLKSFQEIYSEIACRSCKYFSQDVGWFVRERQAKGEKQPLCFGCNLGQFPATHKVLEIPTECKAKNYEYKPDPNECEYPELKAQYGKCIIYQQNMFGLWQTIRVK